MTDRAAKVLAVRVAGEMVVESSIRSRTTPVGVAVIVVAVLVMVAAVVVGGIAAVLLAFVSLLLLGAAAMAFVVRAVTLAAVRRFIGGRQYSLARPIVSRHVAQLQKHGRALPVSPVGVLRLLALTRRPAELQAQVVASGEAIAQMAPQLTAELREALAQ